MRLGGWTLRYAQGPGRQSGVLFLSAVAVACLPATALLRPDCGGGLLGCPAPWSTVLLVPLALSLPAAVAACLLAGTWWAQRRHAPVEKRYFAQLAPSGRLERPPGDFDRSLLERDLVKRTMRGLAAAALVASLGLGALTMTSVALRACDPWAMEGSPLAVCDAPAGWADMILAFETWSLLGTMALASLVWFTRSTSVRVDLPGPRRSVLRLRRRARGHDPGARPSRAGRA